MGLSVIEIWEMGLSGFSNGCAIFEMGFVGESAASDDGVGI